MAPVEPTVFILHSLAREVIASYARAQERPHTLQFPPRTLTTLATVPDSSHGTAIAP